MENHQIIDFERLKNDGVKFEIDIMYSTQEVANIINILNDEINNSNPDFNILKSHCLKIIRGFPLFVNIYKQRFVLRTRPNYNGEVFNKVQDLIYNPYPEKIPLGRFNLEGDPVFYCTDSVGNNAFDSALTGIVESCKELFDMEDKIQYQYFTLGKFKIVKPINVLVLSHFDQAESNTPYIRDLNKYLEASVKEAYTIEDWAKCQSIYGFFSEKAGKKQDSRNSYLLTTAFYHAAKEYYGHELGIMYSSSMTNNSGLNLVFSKELIDADYLKLELAVMYKAARNPTNSKEYRVYPCSSPAYPNERNNFSITGIL